jgi:hypothetical protein
MSQINTGSTLVFQIPPGREIPSCPFSNEPSDTETVSEPTPNDQFSSLKTFNVFDIKPELRTGKVDAYFEEHVTILETIIYSFDDPQSPLLKLRIPPSFSVVALPGILTDIIEIEFDPLKDSLLFHNYDSAGDCPSAVPIAANDSATLAINARLYFQVLANVTESDLKLLTSFRIQLSLDGYSVAYDEVLMAPKKSSPRQLLDILCTKKAVELAPDLELRCSSMWNHGYGNVMDMNAPIRSLVHPTRIDVVPASQKSGALVQFRQGSIDGYGNTSYEGNPFWFSLVEGEKLEDAIIRIKELVQISKPILEVLPLRRVLGVLRRQPIVQHAVLSDLLEAGDSLVIIHEREEKIVIKHRFKERALKIYN